MTRGLFFGQSLLRVAAKGADQALQFLDGRSDPLSVGAAHDQRAAGPDVLVGPVCDRDDDTG